MEPTNEKLDEEIRFIEQKTTGLEEETRLVISFEDAWQREQDYCGRIEMRSLQSSVGSGFHPALELAPKTCVYERKKKAAFLPPPAKKKVCPLPSQTAARNFQNPYAPPQQLQLQQAPAEYRQSLPQKLQYGRRLLQHRSIQRPIFPFPKEQQSFAQDFNYRQNSAKRTPSQHPQPRQLPDHKILPKPLDSHLQSSSTQRPPLQSPVKLEDQQNSTKLAINRFPQPRQSCDFQTTPWNGPPSSSSQMCPRWCDLCDVPCMNDFCYEQHCQGKKHKAKWEETFGNSKEIEMKRHKLLWCKECSVPCVNELALSQHLVGKKHARRLFELQHLNTSAPEVPKFSELKREQV